MPSLRLVNRVPGDVAEGHVPGRAIHLGMRSQELFVLPGFVRVDMGLSNIIHRNSKPEDDETLIQHGADLVIETPERRRPINNYVTREFTAGALKLTKTTNNDGDIGVYEIKVPIETHSSVLAHLTFKKKAWTLFNPDWLNLTNIVGMYFGLEYGILNTAGYAFLRDDGANGQLVVGGPLQAFNTARGAQAQHALAWKALAADALIEVFLYFNFRGYPPPYVPDYTPVFEVWVKLPTNTTPQLITSIPAGTLGQFPAQSSSFPNFREAPNEQATLFFGNAGRTGDVLELTNWALYPDFRVAVQHGEPTPNHQVWFLPDAPAEYKASSNDLPTEIVPGRWLPHAGLAPVQDLFYRPGRTDEALYATLKKSNQVGIMALQKEEPALGSRRVGFMVEAFMAGIPSVRFGDATGIGFGVDDGEKLFKALMVQTSAVKTIGILKVQAEVDDLVVGHHYPASGLSPVEVDFTSLKLVRMIYDRLRKKLSLYVDDSRLLYLNVPPGSLPATNGAARIFFGHIENIQSAGDLHVSFLNYLSRYYAWEGEDALAPDDISFQPETKFTREVSGAGSVALVGGLVRITKPDVSVVGSKNYYTIPVPISDVPGAQLDFKGRVSLYAAGTGQRFAPRTNAGAGIDILLGTKRLSIRFMECGIHGKKIAVIPGSGDDDDILDQSELGRRFSATVDWTQSQSYRLIVKAFDSIKLWVGSVVDGPAITIPWQDDTQQFDLPTDLGAQAIRFGHFDQNPSSTTEWSYMRWGMSRGIDTSVAQSYPDGYGKHIFGGRVLVRAEFDEG